MQAVYPKKRGAKVKVFLKDGRELETEVYDLKGSPNNPVGFEEIRNKFTANVKTMMPEKEMDHLIDLIMNLDRMDSVHEIMEILYRQIG